MNICSYHLQEAGATPVQELAFALATAIAVLDTVKKSGEVTQEKFGEVVGRISFFVNAGLRFVTEICKMRAFVDLWDEITRERYGVTDPKQRLFRYGVQVNSLGLTEPQPENNVARILIEMLAVTLSKKARARAVQLPAWNEALGLPRPWDQQWSLRMQQILAYETDLLEYGDLFDGSKVMDEKVEALKAEAKEELKRIEEMGGAIAAVETGYMKQRLVESNSARFEAIERGEQIVVGVNKFLETEPSPLTGGIDAIMTVSAEAERDQIERLQGLARGARRQGRGSRAQGPQACRDREPQHHAGLDRLRQGRRHHRRMGLDAARGVRRIPRADRRRPRNAQRRHADSTTSAADVDRVSRKLGRRLTFLVGKPGLDGHSNGAEQIAVRARDAGMQVVYEGIRLTPEEIVAAAQEQKAHVIGLSILSGSHVSLVKDVVGRMKEAGHRRPAGGGRRHHPAGGRAGAGRRRRRRGLHAEGFRTQPHHVRRGADRGAGEQRQQRLTIVAATANRPRCPR